MTTTNPGVRARWVRNALIALAALLTMAIVIVMLATGVIKLPGFNTAQDAPAAITTLDENGECRPEFTQVVLDRSGDPKVDARYSDAIRPIIEDSSLSADDVKKAIIAAELTLAGTNVQTLATWANGLGLYEDPNNWRELVEGGEITEGACLTEAGLKVYIAYQDAITAEDTRIEIGTAPATGTNSGINGATTVISATPGLGGDLTAVIITLGDGTRLIKLVRCGNVIWIVIPPLPPGETDHCPTNPNLPPNHPDCLTPKPTNPADYEYPEGKPTVPPVTTPAEATPPSVNTSQPGGNGVVDTPTNNPGSQTGVTAPGSTPAPTTPASPPPNEGGSGDGTVGGF